MCFMNVLRASRKTSGDDIGVSGNLFSNTSRKPFLRGKTIADFALRHTTSTTSVTSLDQGEKGLLPAIHDNCFH